MAQSTTLPPGKNILILGGSYGGVSTAHYLLKHVIPNLSDKVTYQVIMVSASLHAMCRPACPRALISSDMFPQDKLFVGIQEAFGQYSRGSLRFVHGKATQLDHTGRTVSVRLSNNTTEKIPFEALIIATGASTPSPLLGLNLDEESLHASWAAFRRALPTAKSIVVAGGGPAGVETARRAGRVSEWPCWLVQLRASQRQSLSHACDSRINNSTHPSTLNCKDSRRVPCQSRCDCH